ncbi:MULTISPECIES: PIG-L deacetylase family protein [Acidithrix]|uniref:Mycothiol S-conjugate amidase n=1 Tax=Acidithrix ferrooxidans TaxID=1280514 RepID=A0A0D8HM73_9ACTN|nr:MULTISPECIES: PIG-L deacetylase family protein [Acidithrix]KJF19023.1 mycothiol S-conjugate amidase [Acidithrix ferrooxidans]CAG4900990.1 unnamed protein product [Acidithrix sp. C25]
MAMQLIKQVPKSVLCVFAHPDDADIGAGGTIATWAQKGAAVTLIIACLGEKGTTDSLISTERLSQLRVKEISEASKCLGVSLVESFSIPDGEVENDLVLRGRIVERLRSLQPQVVLTHDPTATFFGSTYFNHRDHRELGFAVLDSVFPASHLPHYFPEAGAPHRVSTVLLSGTQEPNVAIDISLGLELKTKAVLSHRTQVGGRFVRLGESIDTTAKTLGRRLGVPYAETFRRIVNQVES